MDTFQLDGDGSRVYYRDGLERLRVRLEPTDGAAALTNVVITWLHKGSFRTHSIPGLDPTLAEQVAEAIGVGYVVGSGELPLPHSSVHTSAPPALVRSSELRSILGNEPRSWTEGEIRKIAREEIIQRLGIDYPNKEIG